MKSTLSLILVLCSFSVAVAQELTPRRWSHLPLDTDIAGIGCIYAQADIFLDPVLQVEDLELEMNTVAVRYMRTFEFSGKSSRFELGQGFQDGTYRGLLQGKSARAHRQGPTDTVLRLSSILYPLSSILYPLSSTAPLR